MRSKCLSKILIEFNADMIYFKYEAEVRLRFPPQHSLYDIMLQLCLQLTWKRDRKEIETTTNFISITAAYENTWV